MLVVVIYLDLLLSSRCVFSFLPFSSFFSSRFFLTSVSLNSISVSFDFCASVEKFEESDELIEVEDAVEDVVEDAVEDVAEDAVEDASVEVVDGFIGVDSGVIVDFASVEKSGNEVVETPKLKVVVDMSGKLIKVVTSPSGVEGGNVIRVVVSASRLNSSNLSVVVVTVGPSVMPSRTRGVVRSPSKGSTGLSASTVSN